MENNKNEMIYITMYADDTGLFSEAECDMTCNPGLSGYGCLTQDR